MAKKKKGRIRQTRTEFQKAFDPYPGMIQPFSWKARAPEFLHISIALCFNKYEKVEEDFNRISDFINDNFEMKRPFHFNLSHTISIIKKDYEILDLIFDTCFKNSFEQILPFYSELLEIPIKFKFEPNIKLLFAGYNGILDGRSDIAILSKYLSIKYTQKGSRDPFGLLSWDDKETILRPENISRIMAMFPPSIGQSENFNLEFSESIWLYNFIRVPHIESRDDTELEESHFKEMKLKELSDELETLFISFKKLKLVGYYHPNVAEVNMGFAARITNLTLDTVDLVKNHKGEIAELVFRTTLETFIVGSWLLNRQDPDLHLRFRNYSVGRNKFFGQKIIEYADDEDMKKEAQKMIDDEIKESGTNSNDVASERGDIFDLRIDQMAEEVWGKDNHYYFLYKRSSGVIHGHWRVMAKYHLSKSHNPMHDGLYGYNQNKNRFAGLIPAFCCLPLAANFLIRVLDELDENQDINSLKNDLKKLESKIWETYMIYYKKYVLNKH
ncbi:DUF5677 domain-containing protein [Gramella lutea]|uniref:DUF5677 domain-containing protein n=1 Tax=Christiangramia lutea TaxID=1607951 RepID=A0A9X1V6J3_9FLAO|nr:DUF5677 domain-containing protein [Christiangramia lutea]MCH4824571.1 DUF5677 domain-containing protein [Christiangramia lutea]